MGKRRALGWVLTETTAPGEGVTGVKVMNDVDPHPVR
jgi:hypothetical protein